MDNDAAFQRSLALIVEAAPIFRDNWLLVGSAAARIAGADVGHIKDIDLLLSARDNHALKDHWRDRPILPATPSEQFRSEIFHRFDAPLPIEAMAVFELRLPNGEWAYIEPKTRIQFGELFAPDIAEQIDILKMMDRAKDAPRIMALERLAPDNLYRPNK